MINQLHVCIQKSMSNTSPKKKAFARPALVNKTKREKEVVWDVVVPENSKLWGLVEDRDNAAKKLRKVSDRFYKQNHELFDEAFMQPGTKDGNTCLFCYVRIVTNPTLAAENEDQYDCPLCNVTSSR